MEPETESNWEIFEEGPFGLVMIHVDAKEEFRKAKLEKEVDSMRRRCLTAICRAHSMEFLQKSKHFEFYETCKIGDQEAPFYKLRTGNQGRAYGVIVERFGKRAFIIGACDKKKQKKANKRVLERAITRLQNISDEIEGLELEPAAGERE